MSEGPVTSPSARADAGQPVSNAELLKAAWGQIRVLSRLQHRESNQLLADALEREAAHVAKTLSPLRRWPLLPKTSFSTYQSGRNQVRIRRVLDFIHPGDRVLDIGIGYGYLTSVLMRDTELDYYCGVDLTERYLNTARQGIEENGLTAADYELEILDLYDLTQEFISRHRPQLILLLEVMEHIPDPKRAFQVLGAAMEEGTSVLFTVPMLGRLEGVWGHRSLYDEARIVSLCQAAGLAIQHVEPVHNTWILVVASKVPESGSQATEPEARPPAREPLAGRYSFRPVRLRGGEARATDSKTAVESGSTGVSFSVADGREGTIVVPVGEPEVMRVEITCEEPETLEAVTVEASAEGEPRMRWVWSLTDRNRPAARPITQVFRNGRPARHFTASLSAGPEGVDAVSFRLTARSGASTSATVHRLAFVRRAG